MYGHAMFFSHFPIFPLIAFLWMMFFMRRFFLKPVKWRSFPKSVKWRSFPETTLQNPSVKIPSGRIPEELKRAGQQIVDNLDWDIRFLEKQCLEVSDPKERKDLEEVLRSKREEYHSVIDRLDL